MIVLEVEEPKQSINLKKCRKTVSSLRIPKSFLPTFERGIQKCGNLSKYLAYILKKYRFLFYANAIPFSENVKLEYQKQGTKCLEKKFRPELKDWLELGAWANALGYSKCKLFALLLEFEYENEAIVNGRAFLYSSLIFTFPFYLRIPRLSWCLRKGRTIFERGIYFYEKPPSQ